MSVAMPAGLPGQFAITDRAFDRLRALVHEQTGMALNDRQRAPVCARLGERLRHHGPTTFGQYSQHLKPGGYPFLGHSASLLGMRIGLKHSRRHGLPKGGRRGAWGGWSG